MIYRHLIFRVKGDGVDPKEELRGLVEATVKAIVDTPDQVDVSMRQGEQTTVYEIRSAKSDLGKVLGKQGSMAGALRKIAIAFSVKHRFRAILEIVE